MLLALLALLGMAASTAAPPSQADAAGNRLETLSSEHARPGEGDLICTVDGRWCAEFHRETASDPLFLLVARTDMSGTPVDSFHRRIEPDQREEPPTLWPHLVRLADGGVLVGLLTARRLWMSGGGGGDEELTLFRGAPGSPRLEPVAAFPMSGGRLVRACFSEEDYRLRGEACHDEYEFAGTVSLDPAVAAGPPRLVLETRARTFPGRAFRLTDEEAAARERRRWTGDDLVWVDDPLCSYRRDFAWDETAGAYVPDEPLPECHDYVEAAHGP